MKHKVINVLVVCVILVAGILAVNWDRVFGSVQDSQKVIELGDVTALKAELNLSVGEMDLAGGAQELLEADFRTSEKPDVTYDMENNKARLTISDNQKDLLFQINEDEEKWEVFLNDSVPTDLEIKIGASSSLINLAGMNISDLDLKSGVGETILDLRGDWEKGFSATIDSGVGRTEIYLPEETGVKVIAKKGIGTISAEGMEKTADGYVNQAYETADVKIEMKVNLGVGELIFHTAN